MKRRKQKKGGADNRADQAAHVWPKLRQEDIPTDVLGSYTGTADDGDQPVQDADDL
nr:hypothetical protein [bacterium]